MSNAKFARLVMVTADNNNKYYEMTYNGGSNFDVKYGRIKSTSQTATYPISKWDTKYREKVNKGYQDVTHTVAITVQETKQEDPTVLAKIEDAKVEEFLSLMQKYTKGLVAKTYTVKAQDVTVAQVNEAQKILSGIMLIPKNDVTSLNSELLKLYMIIPRYMSNVRDYLLPNINLDKTLQQEQDNLDAMSSQVQIANKEVKNKVLTSTKDKKDAKQNQQTLLDLLGVDSMKVINSTTEINHLVKQITGKRTQAIFEVKKNSEEKRLNDWLSQQTDKRTRLVYHGTKCTSVIPILEQGLKIRPTGNFQFSGKVYGNGNYFSDQFNTSIGYTGNDNDSVLLVYEIHTGKESKNSFHDYAACKRAGYDSFEGGWLRVAYHESQSKIKYIIWLK